MNVWMQYVNNKNFFTVWSSSWVQTQPSYLNGIQLMACRKYFSCTRFNARPLKNMWLWYSHMWIRSVQVADGFQGSGRTENLEYSLMKILWAFIAAEKFINLILIFNELAFKFNWQLFSQDCLHLKLCMCRAVQYWWCNFRMDAIPDGISLSGTVTFVGRKSWCNIVPGKEMGSFPRVWTSGQK